jgi:hypothetical protein
MLLLVVLLIVPRPAVAALYCSADRAIVPGGTTVTVTAYSDSEAPPRTGTFSSKNGVVREQPTAQTPWSFSAQWTLPLLRGSYEIIGTRTSRGAESEQCRARVVVTGGNLGPGVQSGHRFLTAPNVEQPGYGSYTYLLCAAPAAVPVRARCESAVKTIIDAVPDIAQYERLFGKEKLNNVYLPTTSMPPAPDDAAAVLKLYNFALARTWLDMVNPTLRDGPYLVTVARPLNAKQRQEMFLQTLDGVPPSLVANWIAAYLRQLAQETAYGRGFEPSLALKMRTVLGVIAHAVPDLSAALRIVY